jgi:hypothetical protein
VERTRILVAAGIGVVVLIVLGLGAATVAGASWLPWVHPATTNAGPPPQVETFPVSSNAHVTTPVQYPQDPPAGGPHAPVWQNCGFYSAPIINEAGVHSEEHGAVWITYRPDLPQAQVNMLRQLAHDPIGKGYVLVSPYPTLPADTPVVASAWGRQMKLHTFDMAALRSVVQSFAAGPQTPEPGAPCSGGTGQPQ